jgi:hypothetical protein
MSKRLKILQASLQKKQSKFDDRIQAHWDDVKGANGQPLNDKGSKGRATLNRWEKQNDSLRNIDKEIEKTKQAIEREEDKIAACDSVIETLPDCILSMVKDGTLNQWRKHPHVFFVNGASKARIFWDKETKTIAHKYVSQLTDKTEYAIFRDTYNLLRRQLGDLAQ